MKAILVIVAMLFSLQATASTTSPDQMTAAEQQQFLIFLNGLEPEMLDAILSEEAFQWYVKQFQRNTAEAELQEDLHGRIEMAENPYLDSNAPVFE